MYHEENLELKEFLQVFADAKFMLSEAGQLIDRVHHKPSTDRVQMLEIPSIFGESHDFNEILIENKECFAEAAKRYPGFLEEAFGVENRSFTEQQTGILIDLLFDDRSFPMNSEGHILRMSLVYTISIVEAYTKELLGKFLYYDKRVLEKRFNDKFFSVSDLLQKEKEVLIREYARSKIQDMIGSMGNENTIKTVKQKFGISFLDYSGWGILSEAILRRHTIVHSGGRVDNRYLEKLQTQSNRLFPAFDTPPLSVGDDFPITQDHLDSILKAAKGFVNWLFLQVLRKRKLQSYLKLQNVFASRMARLAITYPEGIPFDYVEDCENISNWIHTDETGSDLTTSEVWDAIRDNQNLFEVDDHKKVVRLKADAKILHLPTVDHHNMMLMSRRH